ncbi:MAG: hypothetical protein H0W40_03410 [Methylibium sp.]|uniref:hypothetical protein n=1 Tax=Methylibium sp. TaxID=2067992 RepID=UPI0017B6CA71|nr:hypothetical protein [Methylibium sp.]MBA3596412.1 hypothetical protein [Methylibium sp.]
MTQLTQIQQLAQMNDKAIATQTAIMSESNRMNTAMVMLQAKMDGAKRLQK